MTGSHQPRGNVVSVLDVGTSKMCCVIARTGPLRASDAPHGRSLAIDVIGIAHQQSDGIRNGQVTDLSAAERAIRRTVDAAEARAGLAVGSLIVNAPSGALVSETTVGTTSIGGDEVTDGDVERALRSATRSAGGSELRTLHSLPSRFQLDDADDIDDPVGMEGAELRVGCHYVHGKSGTLRNLERAINRAHLEVERMVASPYASALASLIDDEARLGCVVIDMGAGATSWAIMSDGRFVHGDTVAVGGRHVTSDLARGLSLPIEQAERLKVLEANVAPMAVQMDRSSLAWPQSDGANALATIPREQVARIATPRLEETFELVRKRIRVSGHGRQADRRIVLTGGAAQLGGLGDLARRMLARNVRIGRPVGVRGLAPHHKTPAFSTAVGLAVFPQVEGSERHVGSPFALPASGRLARLGRWFRDF